MEILAENAPAIIDYVQEREVVESEHSQDLPAVLAEDDKNPNLPEQQDQILGEQTIEGDAESNQSSFKNTVMPPQGSQNIGLSSYRLAPDSFKTTQRTKFDALDAAVQQNNGGNLLSTNRNNISDNYGADTERD